MFEHWTQYINFNSNKIIKSSKWTETDSRLNYVLRGNKEYSSDSVTYEIDESCFRTSSDTKYRNGSKVIACFGCSHTFGEGLPWEETWPYVLNSMLGEGWSVKNYGILGASNDSICRIIHKYLLYNEPKAICCFFPEIQRLDLFNKDPLTYYLTGFNKDEDFFNAYKVISTFEYCLDNFLKNCKFIEMLCKSKNVKFYWYSWSKYIIHLNKHEISNFFDYDCFLSNMNKNNLIKNSGYARDNCHYGKNLMKELSFSFSEKINNDSFTIQKNPEIKISNFKYNLLNSIYLKLKNKYYSLRVKNNDRFIY
jgi:hypothetical protein